MHALVKLIGDVSGRTTVGWTQGDIFGLRGSEIARPLMRFESARIGRYTRRADGAWVYNYRGVIAYKALDSDRFIDSLVNPYTNESVAVKHYATSIGSYAYTRVGVEPSAAFKGERGEEMGKPFRLPWTIVGDDVWVTTDERVRYRRPSDGEYRVDNAINRYAGKLSELQDPALTSAPCTSSWQTELNWFSWLGMGAQPGMIMQGGAGRKFAGVAQLPAALVEFVEHKFPGTLTAGLDRP